MSDSNTILFSRSNHGGGTEEGSSSDANDFWDDTLLIKTYEKAAKIAMESCLREEGVSNDKCKKSKKKEKSTYKWKIGDHCCCPYSEDGNLYEADIIGLDASSGTCTVKYIGYNNVESVSLKVLQSSKGEAFRSQQIEDAANDNDENCKTSEIYSGGDTHLIQNKITKKKKNSKNRKNGMANCNSFMNISSTQNFNSLIPPPPPPPHLFKNICEDREETEAMSAMLIAWYMSGYHTGYYQGLKMGKKNCNN